MTADVAAAYCSADKRRLPPPSFRLGKSPRWRRGDLDRWLDALAGRAGLSIEDEMLRAME